MRKLLAISFLIIFSFQLIPQKLIGKLLNASQNTEEVQEDGDNESLPDGKVVKFGEDQIMNHYTFDLFANTCGFNDKVSAFISREDRLPSVHVSDVLYPPPDC